MSDEAHRAGDCKLGGGGPRHGKTEGARSKRRFGASKYANRTDMGRDELFRQRLGMVPKSMRIALSDEQNQTNVEGDDR